MPHVAPAEGRNEPFLDLATVGSAMMAAAEGGTARVALVGSPSLRVALVGSPSLRVVLLRWAAGFATLEHHHPRAEEIFLVLEGRAEFTIAGRAPRLVGPGELVLARRGERHAICVPGDAGELLLLAAVAPNEDAPDETVE
jgi:quercetin dioxygenase-like cupin family protein